MKILTNKYRIQEKKEIENIKRLSSNDKDDPEIIYDEIKNAFKYNFPIITTSINMIDDRHEYSILGIYSEENPNYHMNHKNLLF